LRQFISFFHSIQDSVFLEKILSFKKSLEEKRIPFKRELLIQLKKFSFAIK
jgi:hypothetical protein